MGVPLHAKAGIKYVHSELLIDGQAETMTLVMIGRNI